MRYAGCTLDAGEGSHCEEEFPYPSFARLANTANGDRAQQLCLGEEREFRCTYTVRRIPDTDVCQLSEEQQDCLCEMGAGDASCIPPASTTSAEAPVAAASLGTPIAGPAEGMGLLIGGVIAATVVVAILGLSSTWRRRVSVLRAHQGFGVLANSDGAATTFEGSIEGSGSQGYGAEATESPDRGVYFAHGVDCQVASSKDTADSPGLRALV
eukprot:COSAG02_NODE_2774_length_8057_cov_4.361146_4_plen_212_part_00